MLQRDPLWIAVDLAGNVFLFGYEPDMDEEFEEFGRQDDMMFLGQFEVPECPPGGKVKIQVVPWVEWDNLRKDRLCDCGVCNSCNGIKPNKPHTQTLYFVCGKCGHPRIPVTMLAPTNSLDGTVSGPGLDFNALVCVECAAK